MFICKEASLPRVARCEFPGSSFMQNGARALVPECAVNMNTAPGGFAGHGETTPLLATRRYSHVLVWARLITCVTSIAEGYDLSCISGAAVMIQSKWEFGMFALAMLISIGHAALATGAVLGGWAGDVFGRRAALASSYVLLVMGALMMALAPGFRDLLAGRVVQGIGIGMGLGVCTTYMAEIAPKDLRGTFPSLEDMFVVMGVAFGYLSNTVFLGTDDSWRWVLGIGAVLPAAMLICVMSGLLPESPRYLAMHGRIQEASAVLAAIVDEKEAREALATWKAEEEDLSRVGAVGWREVLWPESPEGRRALLVGIGVYMCQQASGINVVSAYTPTVLAEEYGKHAAFQATTLMAAARILVVLAVVSTVDTYGRRTLFLFSSVGCTLSMAFVTVVYHVAGGAFALKVAGIAAFLFFYSAGLGPVSFVYSSEVFSTRVRSKSMGMAFFFGRIYTYFMLLIFPMAMEKFGIAGCVSFNFVMNALILAFSYAILPETACVSLEDMHTRLKLKE